MENVNRNHNRDITPLNTLYEKHTFLICSGIHNKQATACQIEPDAGNWKTRLITSGKEFQLPPLPDAKATKEELKTLLSMQKQIDSAIITAQTYQR